MDSEVGDDPKFDGADVDLGEDLLEATRVVVRPEASSNPGEELQRGEILMNEGLFDEAKKTLRRVLRRDLSNLRARELLDEIQKIEIKELLAGDVRRKRAVIPEVEIERTSDVLERLNHDLHLNLEKSELRVIPDLFKDEQAAERYRESVMVSVLRLAVRDRIDIGIAYLEMGLFDLARAIFETVERYEEYKLTGVYLLSLALIFGGKAIDATIRLEPYARDMSLEENEKAGCLYLMGLAFEKLAEPRKAHEFYRRVHTINPRYRDVAEKLK